MNKGINLIDTSYIFTRDVQNTPINYKGSIDSVAISTLLAETEKHLVVFNSPDDIKKKVLGIMTELLQNMLHHSPLEAFAGSESACSFQLEKRENEFILTASNPIHENNVASFKNQIEHLNTLTPDELTKVYQNILRNGKQTGENARLGLIEIIRKSGKPILVKFVPAGNNYCLLTVKALV